MANILKPDRTYTDVRGVTYTDAYMVIGGFVGRQFPTRSLQFALQIFKDQAAKEAGAAPIFETGITADSNDIATYLGSPQDAADQEIPLAFVLKHVYIYLGMVKPEISSIIWDDWKSDEVGGVPQTFIKTK